MINLSEASDTALIKVLRSFNAPTDLVDELAKRLADQQVVVETFAEKREAEILRKKKYRDSLKQNGKSPSK